jgi:hypothetical protein
MTGGEELPMNDCREKKRNLKITALAAAALSVAAVFSGINVSRAEEGNNPILVGLLLAQNEPLSKSALSEQRGAGELTLLPVMPEMPRSTGVIFWDELQPIQIQGLLNNTVTNQAP